MYRVLVNGTNVYEGPEITRVLEEMCELSQVGDAIEIFQQDGTRWNLIDSESEIARLIKCWHELKESIQLAHLAKQVSDRKEGALQKSHITKTT